MGYVGISLMGKCFVANWVNETKNLIIMFCSQLAVMQHVMSSNTVTNTIMVALLCGICYKIITMNNCRDVTNMCERHDYNDECYLSKACDQIVHATIVFTC